jgi:hypothetical protein
MRSAVFILAFVLPFHALIAQVADFNQAAARFLGTHVNQGSISYSSIANNPAELNKLKSQIAGMSLTSANKDQQLSFYLNAYNILVIGGIVDHWPASSPLKIDGFFDAKKYSVAGKSMTLSDLENEIIRPQFKDARVHFALVCAAKGCPPIASYAYNSRELNEQLEKQTRRALNDNNFIRVDNQNKKVLISHIFEWYGVDFSDAQKLSDYLSYINRYRTSKIPSSYKIDYYEYDWSINGN